MRAELSWKAETTGLTAGHFYKLSFVEFMFAMQENKDAEKQPACLRLL